MATTPFLEPSPEPTPGPPRPAFGGGGGGGALAPGLPNAKIAMVMLLATEAMLFTGLAGAHLVLRLGSPAWPPPGQPRLPLLVTVGNTVLLLASALTMHLAMRAARAGAAAAMSRALAVTALLGTLFLAVQGSEWVRLVGHGLTLQSSTYGAIYYCLIGLHALHVVGALVWLGVVLARARHGRYTAGRHLPVELCAMYWYFVCALWVVLFALVYLL